MCISVLSHTLSFISSSDSPYRRKMEKARYVPDYVPQEKGLIIPPSFDEDLSPSLTPLFTEKEKAPETHSTKFG